MFEASADFMPQRIVAELDQYIIGQHEAKRAVANALRNRIRRLRVDPAFRKEIAPKNILMVGSTGIGKTEIARRLASLMHCPFVKVEATKFTEVGYVGKDVDSIVRDLVEDAWLKVRAQAHEEVSEEAYKRALEKVLHALRVQHSEHDERLQASDEECAQALRDGVWDSVEIDVETQGQLGYEIVVPHGMEELSQHLQQMMQSVQQERVMKRRMNVAKALTILQEEEASKLTSEDDLRARAVRLTEEQGIVFIDEIDKVVRSDYHHGEVSREGVQRDLLPLLDGTVVNTKYGNIKTDYILFIASGAFMNNQPSDMLSELQGRLPVRVHLRSLSQDDLVRILHEPANSLVKQYQALLNMFSF